MAQKKNQKKNAQRSNGSKAQRAAQQTPVVPPMTVSFNAQPYTFDTNSVLERIKAHAQVKAPTPAVGKHKVTLPTIAYPVSLGWAIMALTGVSAQGISKAGNIKGAYHPQQAMSLLAKLTPFGVSVNTDSDNPRYAAFGDKARAALDTLKAQQEAQRAAMAAQALKAQQDAMEAQRKAQEAADKAQRAAQRKAQQFIKRHGSKGASKRSK